MTQERRARLLRIQFLLLTKGGSLNLGEQDWLLEIKQELDQC